MCVADFMRGQHVGFSLGPPQQTAPLSALPGLPQLSPQPPEHAATTEEGVANQRRAEGLQEGALHQHNNVSICDKMGELHQHNDVSICDKMGALHQHNNVSICDKEATPTQRCEYM